MPLFRSRPRGRRRANLQITYPFDRRAYVRWRLRCWAGARVDRGAAVLGRVVAPARTALRALRRGIHRATAEERPGRRGEDGAPSAASR